MSSSDRHTSDKDTDTHFRESETVGRNVEELRKRVNELERKNRRLKKKNEQLRKSDFYPSDNGVEGPDSIRSMFDHMFDSIDTPSFLIDVRRDEQGMSFVYLDVNEAHRRVTGCEPDRFREAVPEEMFDKQTSAYVRTQYCRCVSQERRMVYRVNIDFEGMQGVYRTTLMPFFENDQVESIIGVTEQLPTAREREGNRKEFRRAVEASGHGVMMTDPEGIITYVNQTFEQITGYDRDEVIGKTPAILKSGKHDEAFYRDLWETISDGEVWEGEIINRRKSGELFWSQQTIAPVKTIRGELRSYIAIQEDVTEQKAQKQELVEKSRAIENSPIGIVMTDATEEDNPICYVNEGFEQITGYGREEVIGRNCRFLQGEKTDKAVVDRIRRAVEREEPIKEELRNYRADGELFWNELIITPLRNDEGEVTRYLGYQQDVTKRKESEQSLRVFRETIQRSPDSIFVVDPDTAAIIDVNKTAEQMLGYDREELLEMQVHDVNETLGEGIDWSEYLRRLNEEGPLTIETQHTRRDGSTFPVEVQADFIQFENQSRIVATSRDITERIKAREEIEQQEQRFRILFEEAPIGLWEEDWSGAREALEEHVPEHTDDLGLYFDEHPGVFEEVVDGIDVLLSNQMSVDITGAEDKQTLVQNFRDLVTDETLSSVRDELIGLWNGNNSHSSKTKIHRLDGEDRIILRDLQLVPGQEDDWSRVFVSYRDITESERRKEELEDTRKREERFRKLAENVGGVFWQYDPRTSEYLYLSSHCQQVFGLTKNTLYEDPLAFVENVHPDDLDQVRELIEQNWTDGSNETFRMNVDGDWRWIRVRAYPVEENGKVRMIAGIAEDIHDRVKRQQKLEQQIEETERISQLKSDFVARTTHDLRTPLNSILGMTELLESSDLNEDQREYVRTIQSTGQTMLHITNDILDLDRVESGELELLEQPFSIREVIDEVTMLFYPWLRDEDLELTSDVHEHVPDRLIGDPNRLKQILVNLIGNAVKFTEKGTVEVVVTHDQNESEEVCLNVEVADTGPGIPEEIQSKIFEERRSDSESEHPIQPGAGLGLSVCKSLVELMGGEISLQSEVGVGSTFSFSLPLEQASSSNTDNETDATGKTVALEDAHVLVVDDNQLLRRTLQAQLSQVGVSVSDANNVEEAEAILRNTDDGEEVDVVFLDRRLDGTSGTEFLRELGRDDSVIDTERVYIFTGDSKQMVEEELPDLSCAGIIQKPVSSEQVREAVRNVLTNQASSEHNDPKEDTVSDELARRSLRVLLVEDHLQSISTVKNYLDPVVQKLETVRTGREAIETCQEMGPDVVLMNFELPDMEGREVVEALRRNNDGNPSEKSQPIVIQTTKCMGEDPKDLPDDARLAVVEKPYQRFQLHRAILDVLA